MCHSLRNTLIWLAIGTAAAMPGCGPGNPLDRQSISGEVTLDGQPLDRGRIKLRPLGSDHGIGSGDVIREVRVIGIDARVENGDLDAGPRVAARVDHIRADQLVGLRERRLHPPVEIHEHGLGMPDQRV